MSGVCEAARRPVGALLSACAIMAALGGRIALVVGGSGALGPAVAARFAPAGWRALPAAAAAAADARHAAAWGTLAAPGARAWAVCLCMVWAWRGRGCVTGAGGGVMAARCVAAATAVAACTWAAGPPAAARLLGRAPAPAAAAAAGAGAVPLVAPPAELWVDRIEALNRNKRKPKKARPRAAPRRRRVSLLSARSGWGGDVQANHGKRPCSHWAREKKKLKRG